jgi:hypothetical protein
LALRQTIRNPRQPGLLLGALRAFRRRFREVRWRILGIGIALVELNPMTWSNPLFVLIVLSY